MAKKQDNSKLVSILSYLTVIGWLIAIIIHSQNKSELGGFHLRQSLIIYLFMLIGQFISSLEWLFAIVALIFWIIGLLAAIRGEEKLIPLLGTWAQQWFKGI